MKKSIAILSLIVFFVVSTSLVAQTSEKKDAKAKTECCKGKAAAGCCKNKTTADKSKCTEKCKAGTNASEKTVKKVVKVK